MNKKLKIFSLLIIGLFFISVTSSIEINTSPKINSINSTAHENKTESTPTVINIVMKDDYFVPNKLNIPINLFVQFDLKNEGVNTHTFTFDNTSYGINVKVNPGKSATVDFTAPPTPQVLGFYCTIHQSFGMTGSITVYNPNNSTSTSTTSSSTQTTSNTSTSSVGFDITLLPAGLILLALVTHRKKREL